MPDNTRLQRQHKRLERLSERGLVRSTVLVHQECKDALEIIRPLLARQEAAPYLLKFATNVNDPLRPTNVSQVSQLSPFRYPGGKTWAVPEVRKWVRSLRKRPKIFVEPFAGGAIVGLTIAAENLADRVLLCEKDDDVAAVWNVVFGRSQERVDGLCNQILAFEMTRNNVADALSNSGGPIGERAFRTILKNRVHRGGILAPGAGLVKDGENGKGLLSRWYPETLVRRIKAIRTLRTRIDFTHGDGFQTIDENADNPDAAFFIDPPYTAGGKRAGSRLYTHSEVNHPRLFDSMKASKGAFLMTYDDAQEVSDLAKSRGFQLTRLPMKSTHHAVMHELFISRAS